MKIKVKANRHVVGLRRGETGWVEDSRKVQSLIRVGYLVRVQDLELPLMSANFSDEPPLNFVCLVPVDDTDDEDDFDLALAQSRLDADTGYRVPFDDVLDEFGVTREELDAYDPDESPES